MVTLRRPTWGGILVIVSAAETSSKRVLTLQCRGQMKRSISVTKQVNKSQKQPSLEQYMFYWSRKPPLPLWYTALFLLIWWDTQEPHQDFFYLFHYHFCVATDLSSATVTGYRLGSIIHQLWTRWNAAEYMPRSCLAQNHRKQGGEEFLSTLNQNGVCST